MSRRTVSTDAELDQVLCEIEGFFDVPPVPGSSELTDAQAAASMAYVPGFVANIMFNIQSLTSVQQQSEQFPSMSTAKMAAPPASSRIIGRNAPCTFGLGRKYE